MDICSYWKCPDSASRAGRKPTLGFVCQSCNRKAYCSASCRGEDWHSGHANVCRKSETESEKTRTRSPKKTMEDFDVVPLPGKPSGELGRGAYGCVKLIRERKNQNLYALKTMSKKSIFQYSSIENLKREIKIQRKLEHPHIIKLITYFEDKDNVCLVLEYAEQGSLFGHLRKKKRLTEEEAFVFFFQTCLGIDYLHKHNIIHRDLKPENLLLDAQGNIKLCDFGWSAENNSKYQQRTTFCGTLDYMAPEMLNNGSHDSSLDIWCLGILLYELIHGHAPFKGKTEREKIDSISKMSGDVSTGSNLSPEAADLVNRLLKVNPRDRATMVEIFNHPWMSKHESRFGIKIWSFVYQPASATSSKDSQRSKSMSNDSNIQSHTKLGTGNGSNSAQKDNYSNYSNSERNSDDLCSPVTGALNNTVNSGYSKYDQPSKQADYSKPKPAMGADGGGSRFIGYGPGAGVMGEGKKREYSMPDQLARTKSGDEIGFRDKGRKPSGVYDKKIAEKYSYPQGSNEDELGDGGRKLKLVGELSMPSTNDDDMFGQRVSRISSRYHGQQKKYADMTPLEDKNVLNFLNYVRFMCVCSVSLRSSTRCLMGSRV